MRSEPMFVRANRQKSRNSSYMVAMPPRKLQFHYLLACTCSVLCWDRLQTGRHHDAWCCSWRRTSYSTKVSARIWEILGWYGDNDWIQNGISRTFTYVLLGKALPWRKRSVFRAKYKTDWRLVFTSLHYISAPIFLNNKNCTRSRLFSLLNLTLYVINISFCEGTRNSL